MRGTIAFERLQCAVASTGSYEQTGKQVTLRILLNDAVYRKDHFIYLSLL